MFYYRNVFWHIEMIHRILPFFEADARMNFGDLTLYVGARNRYYFMQPQFAVWHDGELSYSPGITSGSRSGFVGWLPYFNKQWPTGVSKKTFKDLCAAQRIPTPRMWNAPSKADAPYLIKGFVSSFANGLRGPMLPGAKNADAAFDPETAYAEEFVAGQIVKIWCWDDKPAAMEIADMPTITGNGSDTFRQLVSRKATAPIPASDIQSIAEYQQRTIDTVLKDGETLLADFRYGGALAPLTHDNSNVLKQHLAGSIGDQLHQYCPLFWMSIPEPFRRNTLYTLDAILDPAGKLWFLEMNCNPSSHPDLYPAMFEGLFGKPSGIIPDQPGPSLASNGGRPVMGLRMHPGIPRFNVTEAMPKEWLDGKPQQQRPGTAARVPVSQS